MSRDYTVYCVEDAISWFLWHRTALRIDCLEMHGMYRVKARKTNLSSLTFVLRAASSEHGLLLHKRHNLVPLDSLLLFKRLVVVFRSLHSLGSCLLDSLFTFRCNSNRTSTVTRAQVTNCLALPDVRTRSGLQSLSYTATKEWNSLPPLIRCVCSQPTFLLHLRNHLGHPVKRLRSVGTA